jgi:hypothetical protein
MTARLGSVVLVERVVKGGVPTVEVQVSIADETITAELLLGPGCDSLPIQGDEVLLSEGEGAGATYAMAFGDAKNAGTAEGGEWRGYSRDADGDVIAECWLKKDGTAVTKNKNGSLTLKPDGTLDYGDGLFVVDLEGNAKFKGEVTAKAGTPEAPLPGVKLSTHKHGSGVGPTTPPLPDP